MARLSRRAFLAGMAAAGAAMAGGHLVGAEAAAGPRTKRGSDVVALGKSNARLTVLGVGTGTRGGSEQRAMGTPEFTRMIRHALDRGVRYIDTADRYMTHVFIRLALEGVKRDQYFIQTKTPAKDPVVARADIERYRRELRTDYLDTVLMHCMTKPTWPTDMRPVLEVLLEEKQKGRIKAVGVSCHGWNGLAPSIDCRDLDVQLVRINPFGLKMDGKPEAVAGAIAKMHAKGRGVIGMKIYGEGGLGSREKRFESLKYVLGLGTVDCFTIGFTAPAQIDETLDLIERASKELASARPTGATGAAWPGTFAA